MLAEKEIREVIAKLDSDDPAVRRETAELFSDEELPDEIAEIMANKITDPDKGVRDSVAAALIKNHNPTIPAQVVPYIASNDIASRNLAGEILLRKGQEAVEDMLSFLAKGNDDDKKFIVDVLGLIGDLSAQDEILNLLRTNKNDNVILACIEALGNIKSVDSVSAIVDTYYANELYKPTAIEALGKIGTEAAVKFLAEKFNDVDDLTKFPLIESLGSVGLEDAFFLIISELQNMNGPLAWSAIEALKQMKDRLNLDVPFDEHMKNSILNTLVDGELKHKRAAANLLSVFNDKEIIGAALNILGLDEEIDSNLMTKFFDNPRFFFPKITEHMKTSPQNIKNLFDLITRIIEHDNGESLMGLSDLELRNICDVFVNHLEHPDEEIRKCCVELLFFINPEMAYMFSDKMLHDNNMWNRLRLIEILGSFNDPRSIDAIRIMASDPEEMVRERALESLNLLGISTTEFKAD